jgi:hypothetical protein
VVVIGLPVLMRRDLERAPREASHSLFIKSEGSLLAAVSGGRQGANRSWLTTAGLAGVENEGWRGYPRLPASETREVVMPHESTLDGGQAASLIAGALARTRAAGGARIELRIGERPVPATIDQPISVLRHPMRSFARWVVKSGSAARSTEGVIDLRARRYMLFGPYAQVYVDGEHRGGAPGRSLASLTVDRNHAAIPLWLCDLLDGVTAARQTGREELRGAPCRVFSADLDARSPALPPRWSTDPERLQPAIWIDADGDIRQIEVHTEDRAFRLELWDFAADADALDWTRLPTADAAEES